MYRSVGRHTYDGKIAGLYDLEETLGRGHFAVVKLARHVFTGEKVAVKVIDKSKLDEISRAHLFQEVRCMKLVQHPNVVRLYEVIDTQTKLYLILELGDGGDLYDYIMRHESGLDEELAREYFRQIVRAISYCHRLHVVHRDLKPENVVFFERLGMVKLTDFGFSNRFNPGQKLETSCGSLAYSAPEILLGDSYDAPAVDVWSLGVILYMLVCGQAPFQEANDSETLTMIMDCKYTVPIHVSSACQRLIARMLIREPERRASLEQIAADPWLGDLKAQPADFLPLISREHVSDDDHALIIQKMVNGNIASKEEILDALDRNEYNHITATYFLLAERKLRALRQEQAQAQQKMRQGHLPDLSQLSSGKPFVKVDTSLIGEQNSPTTVNQSLLSVSRTPGDLPQNYRARKCSIVQEEEDEDDMSSCSGREELAPPHCSLNRRGSRSEGKLNLALQERLAESERRKEKNPVPQNTIASGGDFVLVGVKDDISQTCLGKQSSTCWVPPNKKFLPINKLEIGSGTGLQPSNVNILKSQIIGNAKWRPSLKPQVQSNPALPPTQIYDSTLRSSSTSTNILTESSTISIPVHTPPTMEASLVPKYKTMPSPNRPIPSILTSPQLALNEIFEEGDGGVTVDVVGSCPSPRNFVGRQQGPTRTVAYEQRRSKFHKARTASCSSSDASDDDSESRKKRAHKLGGGKSIPQRRDSHDDSSDSQDPGGNGGTGGGAGGGQTECSGGSGTAPTAGVSEGSRTTSRSGTGANGGRRHCSGTTQNPPFSRRHRAGRRRSGETRLRESQSLNRITEVQEAEHTTIQTSHNHITTVVTSSTFSSRSSSSSSPKVRGFGARLLQSWSLTSSSKKPIVLEEKNSLICNSCTTISEDKNSYHSSSNNIKSCSPMRVGSLFKDGHSEVKVSNATTEVLPTPANTVSLGMKASAAGMINCCPEEKENCSKAHIAKSGRDKDRTESSGKKVRLLGRYFQVHKKLCLPLPGLFGRGRLYKAQSCGSIVRDHVAPPSPASLLLCGDDGWCSVAGKTSKHVKSGEDTAIRVSNGNKSSQEEGDINQNLGLNEAVITADSMIPLGANCPGIGICHIHLGDASKCCNLC